MASSSFCSLRMVVSKVCKATSSFNSAFTLYALLKRSGLTMLWVCAIIEPIISHPWGLVQVRVNFEPILRPPVLIGELVPVWLCLMFLFLVLVLGALFGGSNLTSGSNF